nr:hypothetical protein [uncultured Flavobacterium sp.]
MTIYDVDLQDIYDFMENGNPKNAPAHIVEYLDLLDMVRGMYLRIDKYATKEAVVKHLMVAKDLSRYKANAVYDEAMQYFYCDSKISKKAWRNIYAEKAEKMINFSMQTVQDVSDAQKVVKMLLDASKIRGLDEPDEQELPEDVFRAPFVVYTADAEMLGLPMVDRRKLEQIIESVPDLTEKEKQQIKREAQILPIKVFPNEQEDPRKS